ncbi:hypothetical protein Sru01_02520 [Sphaerisporangium rufum]|uniref:Signal transduction histidine-protein kinase/phosphatase MprB n=1 Tax=Sphaerisporangium rufum TaxID=1381558 RepID=A0A919V2G3_9ACTN|nr:DUF4153 domain-containing protein [Sphaerisporangium rufum]GII75270.1 hypothetical protein Sru01_02520 [Sphaerisporangium rufum]
MRPLDFLGRIKAKLGLLILLAVATAFAVNEYGRAAGVAGPLRMGLAALLSLVMVQVLAWGMTRPLREMAAAAQTIAKGRYGMRVRATSRDEVGELARAFNAMAADLGEVDRQRRELVANVSHELRTPIAGLQAVLENLVDGVSEPRPATLSTALAQTERLGRLVAQLLDLSRLDSGARTIEAEPVDLGALCEQAAREARLAREEVTVSVEVTAGLATRADPALLAQVLANLLDNAVRHSPHGGVVRLTGRPAGSGVRLAVADRGPGIPVAERARVFERFSRLDTARGADRGGAGLGLAIVKEIVELHGGSIGVAESRAGCHMAVDLPGRIMDMDAGTAAEPPPVARGLPAPTAAGREVPARLAGEPGEPAGGPPAPAGVAGPVAAEPPAAPGAAGRPSATDRPPAPGMDPPAAPDVGRSPVPGADGPPAPGAGRSPAAWADRLVAARADRPVAAGAGGPVAGGATGLGQDAARERALAGGSLGLACGFVVGVCVALFVDLLVGAFPGIVVLIVFSAGGGVLGTALGAAEGRGTPGGRPPSGGGPSGYVPPPLLPRPLLPETPPATLPLAAAVGLLAAVVLPEAPAGVGTFLVAVAAGAAVLPAARHRVTPWTAACGVLAYGVVAVVLLRDGGWLAGPALLGGFGLASLAVAGGGRGWLGVLLGGVSVAFAAVPVPWFLAAPLKRTAGRWRLRPLAAGLGLAALLTAVFGLLFASADPVFSALVERLVTTPEWATSVPVRLVMFAGFAALVGAATLVALRPVAEPAVPRPRRPVARGVWLPPLVAVDLLFAAFVALQLTTLFGGNRQVLRTAGLTYAEYARSGFFQLMTVSVLVLGIVAIAGLLAGEERRVLAATLGPLCVLTLVVLVSAWHRLGLYTDAYGLTRLRASVGATIWWLGAIFVMVLAAGVLRLAGRSPARLPRAVVLVTAVTFLAFAGWNPEQRIAETQIQARGVDRLDVRYLADLGADAVPVVDRLPEPARSCLLYRMAAAAPRDEGWAGWNLPRGRARELLRARPPLDPRYLRCEIGSAGT